MSCFPKKKASSKTKTNPEYGADEVSEHRAIERASRVKVAPKEMHKVFVWMGLTPSIESPCGTSLHEFFPGALPGAAVVKRVATILRAEGFTPHNTLYGQSICSDEINNEKGELAPLMQEYWGERGENFPLGGIGGAPYAGKTGFGAFSHHVPKNGNVIILYGPHVAVSETGELGKFKREGQDAHSDACGACVAAYKQCCAEHASGQGMQRKPSINDEDMQQAWLRGKVRPHVQRIMKADEPLADLTKVVYEAIDEMTHHIVNHDFGEGKLVLLGGIQVNLPRPYDDHFVPLTFEVSSKASPKPRSLLHTLQLAKD